MFRASATSKQSRRSAAFTFVEILSAAGIVAIFLAGAFTTNSRGLYMVRCAKETATASKILQQRMEQLRSVNWTEVTNAESVQELYSTEAHLISECKNATETVIIGPWPGNIGGDKIQISKPSTGPAVIVQDNENLVDGSTVLVKTRITWTGAGNRTRIRETCTVIANGGLGR